MAIVSPEVKLWLQTNVKQLVKETADKEDALEYVEDLTRECLEACDLSVDHEKPVSDEIKEQLDSLTWT